MNNSKRIETVVKNIPDFTEAYLTKLELEERSRTTPTLAELQIEQLEEKLKSETEDRAHYVDTQAAVDLFPSHKADSGA